MVEDGAGGGGGSEEEVQKRRAKSDGRDKVRNARVSKESVCACVCEKGREGGEEGSLDIMSES